MRSTRSGRVAFESPKDRERKAGERKAGERKRGERKPDERQPRERLAARGPEGLDDAELLALLLRTGSRECDARSLATRVLDRFGGLRAISSARPRAIERSLGVGPAKAATLCAAFELARRLYAEPLVPGDRIRSPLDVQRHFEPGLSLRARESFHVLLLDSRHRLISAEEVSTGTLTASLVHPREVFRDAIRSAAAALVLVHNHPSGDPSPSPEDRAVTRRLVSAGSLIGIRIIDHVIVSPGGHFSFREAGEDLDPPEEEVSGSHFSESP